MTKILATILSIASLKANATTYYVSNAGSDAANGTSTGTSWQTIAKVNASTFAAGDNILFKAGDTWNERLNVPNSGSANNVITFGSYGSGNKPIITGWQTLVVSDQGSNIWGATATNSVKKLNTVMVNGGLRFKARIPNTGWSTFSSYSGDSSITTALSGTPNYTGSELVVRDAHWIIDVVKVGAQSGGVLSGLSPKLTYTPSLGGNGYFLQNVNSALDVVGEWTYDSTSKAFKVYATSSPTVLISTIDTLININHKDYVTIDGLNITGANIVPILIDTSNHVTVKNCTTNYSGAYGIIGHFAVAATLLKDSVINSLSNGVYLRESEEDAARTGTYANGTCDSAFVDSTYIGNSAIYAGMGLNKNGRYEGLYIIGHYPTVTNNRVDSSGYSGIDVKGKKFVIAHNYVTNFEFVKDDGGGIYTGIGGSFAADFCDSSRIDSNIVVTGVGATAGTTSADDAAGIFTDSQARLITLTGNTIINCQVAGLKTYGVTSITARGNNVINNVGYPRYIQSTVTTCNFKNNAFLSNSSSWNCLFTEPTSIATSDSNYFSRPTSESNLFNRLGTQYTLAAFVTLTSQEAHSGITPPSITVAAPLVVYNPTGADSVVVLTGLYVSIRGTFYNNFIRLHAYQSDILYKSDHEIIFNNVLLKTFKLIQL